MDAGQTTSLGSMRRNNRDRNSVTFDRFVYTSNKSYQRLDGDDVVDVDAAEGAGGDGGDVTKNSSASSRRATSNKSKNFKKINHLRALDNKQQPVIVENKPKNVKFASTLDSKQPKQKQSVVNGETKTIRKDDDSAEDDVEVEVVIEEVSVRVPAKINVHERQTNKRNLLTTMQQLRRMRLLKHQHHHPLIDDDDSDDDIVCEEEEEGVQSDDDSLLGAKCETTDVLSSKVSKVMSNQRGAFSGVTFGNVKIGMGCHEVSDDDETMITTRTESPLSHEGGEELDDTLILEDVIVDIAESFRRFAMCEDLFNCGPQQQQQQQQKIKRRKVIMTTDDKKQQQHKNETSYCTCNEVLL